MTPKDLRRQAADFRAKAQALLDTIKKENRDVSDDERAILDDFKAKMTSLEGRATTLEELEKKFALPADAAANADMRQHGLATADSRSLEVGSIEPVRGGAEGDKQRSYSNWLYCVDAACDAKRNYREIQDAREALDNLYRSQYRAWDDPKRSREVRGLSAASGTAGGFLMPTDFYNNLMQVAAPMAIVRPRAMVIPMGAQEIEIPSLDQTTAQSAGSPPWFGGVILDWTAMASGANTTATQPGFRKTRLRLSELTGYCPVPRGLIQRSAISLEPLIYTLFGGAVAYAEDYAFLRGDGNGQPMGILNSACSARIITATARGSATAISFANATAVWTRVLDQESQSRGVWLVSKSAESAVLTMTGSANAVFHPTGVYTANSDTVNAGPSGVMLYMRPVLVSSKLPAINTDGDFGFYDFSKYVIGDGGPPEVAASDDYLFRTNERAFRIVHNVAGATWMNNPVTLEDASTTVSPFVSLKIQ